MLKIRLQRTGRINDPSFRIIVVEHTESTKTGNFVERVGTYNPKTKEKNLIAERIVYWISKGAKASATVHNMLVSAGIVKGKKIIGVYPPKQPIQPYFKSGGSESHRRHVIKTITTSYTLDPLDDILLVNAASGNITVTIYSTAGNEGNTHFIKRVDTSSNTVSFSMTGSDTLDAQTLYQLVNYGSGAEIFGDGSSSWFFKHL